MGSVLTDDGVCEVMLSIFWCSNSIEDAGEDDKKPSDDRQDLISPEALRIMALAT